MDRRFMADWIKWLPLLVLILFVQLLRWLSDWLG